MTLTVPCLFGLESLVADEMKRLQLQNVRAENGRVHCEGSMADIARLNINLRCGARVLMELGSFPAKDFEALFQGVLALPWEDFIPRDGEFPVKGYSLNSTLHSVPACQAIVKKASGSNQSTVTILTSYATHDRALITNYYRVKHGSSFHIKQNNIKHDVSTEVKTHAIRKNHEFTSRLLAEYQNIVDNPSKCIGDRASNFLNFK